MFTYDVTCIVAKYLYIHISRYMHDMQAGRQTGRQAAERQKDRQTDRQTDRQRRDTYTDIYFVNLHILIH